MGGGLQASSHVCMHALCVAAAAGSIFGAEPSAAAAGSMLAVARVIVRMCQGEGGRRPTHVRCVLSGT